MKQKKKKTTKNLKQKKRKTNKQKDHRIGERYKEINKKSRNSDG